MTEVSNVDMTRLTGRWRLDPAHTRIWFSARHAMVTKVRGSFGEFEGKVTTNGADPASSGASVTINTASVTTQNEGRDKHLRSADFLDVDQYPQITFVSTAVEDLGGGEYTLRGDLTIKDVTRSIDLQTSLADVVVDHRGNRRMGLEATGTLSRQDWGLTWNAALETGGVLVSDRIGIELDVSLIEVSDEQ